MNLLITKGDISSIWQVEEDQRATKIDFIPFGERDLCPSSCFLRSSFLPLEIVEKILVVLFNYYLETWNFDLCTDLLLFSRSFTGVLYRKIYGANQQGFYNQYSRLSKTFLILENIYDQYLSVEGPLKYHCLKLTSVKSRGSRHQPWDFIHEPIINPIVGVVVDLTDTQLQVQYGKCYGESVWLSGSYRRHIFQATEIKTPVINLMFVDIFDTLIHTAKGFNNNYLNFFRLIKTAFGSMTGLFIMVKEEDDNNPFITRSDLFLEF